VLRYEDSVRDGELLLGAESDVAHVRAAGSDARAGDPFASPGSVVTPMILGLAASLGYDELVVHRRPRVAVIVTGTELISAGPAAGAQVRDALSPMLPPLIEDLGADVVDVRRTDDEGLRTTWASMAGSADVVVTTGSTSLGMTDRLPQLAQELGVVFRGVRCRPGHPQLLAGGGNAPWLVGLPGNPFAALVACHTTLGPLLHGLSGRPVVPTQRYQVRREPSARPGVARVFASRLHGDELELLPQPSSAWLGPAAAMDGLAVLDDGWSPGLPGRFIAT